MKTIDIIEYANKYGWGPYLDILRKRYRAKLYSRGRFCGLMARAYFLMGKPRRAAAIVALVPDAVSAADAIAIVNGQIRQTERPAPTCCLNMIVKNEEKNIAAALSSVDDIMDEIVVCDTGSDDNTVAEALLFGARIVRFPWNGDFSQARNAALKASGCDHVFWMDADDRVDNASRQELALLCRRPPGQAAAFCVANEYAPGSGAQFMQIRLFPRRPEVYFEGRVHEQIVYSLKREGVPVYRCESIKIIHLGYNDPQTHREKAARNLTLIAAELADHPQSLTLRLSLGDCHVLLGNYAAALALYRAIAHNERAFHQFKDVYVQALYNCAMLARRRGDEREARRYLYRCLYCDPSRGEAAFALGLIYLRENSFQKACLFFLKSIGASVCIRDTATDHRSIKMHGLYFAAVAYCRLKQFKQAEMLVRAGQADFPQTLDFYNLMGKILFRQYRFVEACRVFVASVGLRPLQNSGAYFGLACIYRVLGESQKARLVLRLMHSGDGGRNIQAVRNLSSVNNAPPVAALQKSAA
ncbi:MAG: glycosyltransferase [Chitinivibrionales bacterium]|nr:glycosyltransferase [Chitinivibrionales bacterium]